MAEMIVGFFILFILGIFNKKDGSNKNQDHILPIFFDQEFIENKHMKAI